MYCTQCGMELPEEANVCSRCGAKVDKPLNIKNIRAYAGQKVKKASANIQGKYHEFKEEREKEAENKRRKELFDEQQRAQNGYANTAQNGYAHMYVNMSGQIPLEYEPISMWGYFGYRLLFSIPVIGVIFLLVFALGGTQNKNLKNYARSYFCTAIIVVVIVLFVILIFSMNAYF